MTIESLNYVEVNSEDELNNAERLVMKKINLHHEIGRISIELSRLNQELSSKIAENIQLNQDLAEAGVDTHSLAVRLQTPLPHEESELFSGKEPHPVKSLVSMRNFNA